MQRTREKLKFNPTLYEEAKRKERHQWHDRQKTGKVKTVKDLRNREKRAIRKDWRGISKRYCENKKQQETAENFDNVNTPPRSPFNKEEVLNKPLPIQSTSRVESGKKKVRRNRDKMRKELKEMKEKWGIWRERA
ncbi:hypothetical protein PR048_009947 [Dryococelus australis]|uniref:Uncharacterized protein n=1 Tax=Dryococelus australis TaxID=614101 RepID=A0ABQ9I377_9NEOP|nr:hypothetical protein PR048_009947 [Dryococelus australis]